MKTLTRTDLGDRILIVMDNCDSCLEQLSTLEHQLPNIASRHFTLLHCVPPTYWEHGGDGSAEAKQVWEAEDREFNLTDDYLNRSRVALEDCGVPASQIQFAVHTCSSTREAVLKQMNRASYSGVILSDRHHDLAELLSGHSLFGWFMRRRPSVTVWEIELNGS